jgi:hypothetical protein
MNCHQLQCSSHFHNVEFSAQLSMNLVIRFYGHSNNLFFFAATRAGTPLVCFFSQQRAGTPLVCIDLSKIFYPVPILHLHLNHYVLEPDLHVEVWHYLF